ncbi:MAG: EAL domain-containing protein [Pseudonocardiales bacterium]|nr:EAL domain-containing protein [Pseudonocardiales bacterium]
MGDGAVDSTAEDVARCTSVGLVVLQDGEVRWLNDAARDLVGSHGGSWTGPGSPVPLLQAIRPGTRREMLRWPSPVGGTRWWEITCRLLGAGGAALLYEITDETAHRPDTDRNDRWRLARLEALAGMGSWEWDPLDNTVEWSDALQRLFGLPRDHVLDFDGYRALVHRDDVAVVENTLADALRTGEPFTYTHRVYTFDRSSLRTFECYGEVFTDAAGAPMRVLGTARDVTEELRAREELAYLAEHDPLTGIANRRRFTARLAECLQEDRGPALLLVDVDHFKDINDIRGHAAGDKVMRTLARVLAAQIGPRSMLGRLGGDEFAAVVPDCDAHLALELAERLCTIVRGTEIPGEDAGLRVTVSIGAAALHPGQDVESGLAQADLALYEAKGAGRDRARLFARDQYDQAVRRVSVLERVRAGLDHNTMTFDAQPIVNLRTRTVTRHELLIRLRDGLEPVLGPAEFLPAAERTDLVLHLDRWVLERAVAALATPWARESHLQLEVNVSARSLDDAELGPWILAILARAGVEPQRLGLEVTETAAISSLDAARDLASRLTRAGCGFTLDDFGAGFGSFSHLKHLPFTGIKIAGDFVRQLDGEPVDRALVGAVVGVAHQLGITTVAEQVDRAALVEQLRRLGVDDGQGYHLGRPRPLREVLAAL